MSYLYSAIHGWDYDGPYCFRYIDQWRLLARKEFGKLNNDNKLEICKKDSIDLSKINTKKLDNYTIAELLSNKDNNLPLVHGLNNNKVSLGFSAGN